MKAFIYTCIIFVAMVAQISRAETFTWTGATDRDWATASNWSVGGVAADGCPGDGDDILISKVMNQPKIPAGTWPATGRYGSFTVSKDATVTCLGDKTVVNEASGGTEDRPHGMGVTIRCDSASIAGTLSADAQGFSNTDAKRPNPGQGSNFGGVHGNVIYNGSNLFSQYGVMYGAVPYGDPAAPTALGDADTTSAGTGGGAIKLDVLEDLALTGVIRANSSGRAAGGSVWLVIGGTFSGTGSVRADAASSTRNGSGGRIAIAYGAKTFTGLVSAQSPSGTSSNSGSGTLWEPMRYPKGSADAPADVTIDGSFVYLVPDDEVRYWNLTVTAKDSAGALVNAELHGGKIAFGTLMVNGNLKMDSWWDGCPEDVDIVSIGSLAVGPSARLSLPGVQVLPTVTADSLSIAADGVLYVGWGDTNAVNEAAGGTSDHPFGRGQTIVCKTLELAGTISAVGRGFGTIAPLPMGTASNQGAGHGGTASGWSTQVSPYGSLSRPTELAEACYDGQNYVAYKYGGGGAVRLVVDELNFNGGTVSALASLQRSAGGSVWVQAKTANGAGTLDAHSNAGTQTSGGGRVAFEYVNGSPSVSYVVGGATKAYPGTVFVAHQASADAFATDSAKPDLTSEYSKQGGNSATFPDAAQKTATSGLFVTREVSAWSVRSGTFEWTEKSYTTYPVESVPTVTPLENLATYTLSNLHPGKKYQIKIDDVVQFFDGKDFILPDEDGRITFQATLAASNTPTAVSVKCLSNGGLILLLK